MTRYGLPTYPIADGMQLGKRNMDELQWLIDHGFFERIDVGTIKKIDEACYQFFFQDWPLLTPSTAELAAEACSLEELLSILEKQRNRKWTTRMQPLSTWRWRAQ
jgi:hypothetical protein